MAIWLPRDEDTPGPVDYDTQLAAACGPYLDRFKALDAVFAQHHPQLGFHHYLQFIAVQPGEQSHGIGSALLDHHHRWLDHDGIAAYLEASKTSNRDLYLRHGYAPAEPFCLPNDGPPLWPIRRAPQDPGTPRIPRC
ncbi:GNAT family N-acetyltransferase [Catellatospora chokoriensis]|uniref:N-acetyltransferase domain-containing protein n=1 Tax=Catellatospora chokoriensis TaxID=310353 RepID=A0A8J3K4P6_9ACTN|nr:GNAT family N-acetyltransferase [Catellatospora chokoriensis]GIF90645.1 hypothetical protein Cch02nite_40890 [Catellatospora chokoriensis]